MTQFDLAILGAGPGGYSAALHAGSQGLKTVLIERSQVGGVCLNQGCIPTKVLLSAAKWLDRLKVAAQFGIQAPSYGYDFPAMLARKDTIVSGLRQGMEGELKRAGVTVIRGRGKFVASSRIRVDTEEGVKEIEAQAIIISTGSRPKPFPGAAFDGRLVLSSDDILNLSGVPKSLIVIGGGVTGVEFASLFESLGARVTILEALERLIPGEDSDLGKRLERSFKRRGIQVQTGAKVSRIVKTAGSVTVELASGKALQGDQVLISIGRIRNTEDLGLKEIGVEQTRDAIQVNEYLETTAKNVYAIGDVTTLPQLAHVASFGGMLVVRNFVAAATKFHFPSHAVPNCIFCDPLVASVGLSGEEATRSGRLVTEVKLPLSSQGRAHVEHELEGFVKLVVDEKEGTVLGAHMIGGEATEVIGALTLAVSKRLTVRELAHTLFAHPTYHEMIGDAARAFRSSRAP